MNTLGNDCRIRAIQVGDEDVTIDAVSMASNSYRKVEIRFERLDGGWRREQLDKSDQLGFAPREVGQVLQRVIAPDRFPEDSLLQVVKDEITRDRTNVVVMQAFDGAWNIQIGKLGESRDLYRFRKARGTWWFTGWGSVVP